MRIETSRMTLLPFRKPDTMSLPTLPKTIAVTLKSEGAMRECL